MSRYPRTPNPWNFDSDEDYYEAVHMARAKYRADHPPLRVREGAPVTADDFPSAKRDPSEVDPF